MSSSEVEVQLVGLTAGLAMAYLSNNNLEPHAVSKLIININDALKSCIALDKMTLAPPAKDIDNADYIVSLENGKKYKTLIPHLRVLKMTPAEYREKWGLPRTYPMVAASYSKRRSEIAKDKSLGRHTRRRRIPDKVGE